MERPLGLDPGERETAGSVERKVAYERAVAHDEFGFVAAWVPSEVEVHADVSAWRVRRARAWVSVSVQER
jgi:hypothetical protein